MNKLRALLAGLILPVLCVACVTQPAQPVSATVTAMANASVASEARYIVQAADVVTAATAVESVGGEVTHELAVIRAVGAKLTKAQAGVLRKHDDIVRVFADGVVKTAAVSCAVSAGATAFEDRMFHWTLTNHGSSTVTVGAITVAWPSTNGALKEIKVDGKRIWRVGATAPFAQIVDGWENDVRLRQLAPGETASFLFHFDTSIDWNEANYSIFVDFEEGCSVEFMPRVMDCRSNGLAFRKFGGNKIEWSLPNDGSDAITLDELSLNWPESNGDIKKIKFEGSTLFEGLRVAPVTTLADGWGPDIRERRILPGQAGKLEIEFTSEISVDEEAYSMIAQFSENCRADFAPSMPFVGDDQKVDKKARDTHFVRHVGADLLHDTGITGKGVTVAVLDTGLWSSGGGKNWLRKDYDGQERILRAYDAIRDVEGDAKEAEDKNGHGSHVTSIILSSRKANGSGNKPVWNGVAPGVSLVSVKAFDEDGSSTYMDVIRGIDWVVRNKDVYGIRVLNLSLSAPPRSHYWDDPLNQAVMAAWQAGIVVVASAGNSGPDPMSVGVPGNVPYVITVGAMTDNRTPFDASDDRIASFSAAGPTYEGFVKPEMVAPGGRLLGVMNKGNRIPKHHKDFHDGDSYYYMSGTSQSAAVVSGVAALLLEAEPALTPDQLKCKLMSGARPATDANGNLAASVFQQGAGLVDAKRSLESTNYACANVGLDVAADLAGEKHFGGRANKNPNGDYYLMGLDGYMWTNSDMSTDGFLWTNGFMWTNSFLWTDGFLLTNAFLWTDGRIGTNGFLWTDGFLWTNAYMWTDGFVWTNAFMWTNGFLWTDSLTEEMNVNSWVEQE